MTQPILTLDAASEGPDQAKASVNLLPCRIHHDGEVGAIDTYWNPAVSKGQWLVSGQFPGHSSGLEGALLYCTFA